MPDYDPAVDERWMQVALELAAGGQGHVEPNPLVGCVIVQQGDCIGQGFHARFGGPHAEVAALASLKNTHAARGSTAYVTLEPCCHYGKTPPCAAALIDAGIARVVMAMQDPFSRVNGGGLKQLADAGIATTVGVLNDRAQRLNAPYLKRLRHGFPYVIAKWAMTADGRIATAGGESQWITGEASRRQVHVLRGRVDAIITAMGTVEADDPLLTARPAGPRTARRVVFCRSRLPSLQSRLLTSIDQAPVMLVVAASIQAADLLPLRDVGVEVVRCPSDDAVEMVITALGQLASHDATNVMLEGGGALLASFLAADQIDECHVYIGAKIFGGRTAPGPFGGDGVLSMDQAFQLQLQAVDRLEDDVRVIYRRRAP
jgi:diaminohydroxyphosphoribosylaminopyrimidine deaminase/5-amino-6-(5-phosphoribosylamino)uracil reductase